MSQKAPDSDKPNDIVSKETIQTPSSTQQTDSTTTTVPRMATPEADSVMARFLTGTISNLASLAPLPPNTPTGPKAMSLSLKDSSAASKSTSATPAAPSTKTRPPFSLITQKQEFEFRSSQQSGDFTPSAKRHTSWSRERQRQESPCPDGARKKSNGGWDHWSPGTKPRRDLFADGTKGYRGVESGVLSRKEGDRSLRRKYLERTEDGTTRTEKERTAERKMKGKSEARREIKKTICYNCGKVGHSFIDCLVKCGHCEGGGHKTMHCSVLSAKSKTAYKKA